MIVPGAMQLTRMRSAAYSTAACCVSETIAPFGGGVRGPAGKAAECLGAGGVHDRPAAACAQVRDRVLHRVPDALEVDREDAVPVLVRGVGDAAAERDAGVAGEHVEASVAVGNAGYERLHLVGPADVGGYRQRTATSLLDLGRDPGDGSLVDVGGTNRGALRREAKRDRPADALGRSRHDADLAVQPAHAASAPPAEAAWRNVYPEKSFLLY
jgi:hypothetical protein